MTEQGWGVLLAQKLRSLLFELDRIEGTRETVRRGLAVLRSFVGSLKLSYSDVTLGLDIDPEAGTADTGNLELDLPDVFLAVAEAAAERKHAIAIFLDEIQYFDNRELGALIMSMHQIQQRQLPLVLVGAGLPILPGLAGESKSYAERLFEFPPIGPLTPADAARALQDPAIAQGVRFEQEALDEIVHLTQGYPYFVQEWGYRCWNLAPDKIITLQTVQEATKVVFPKLDQSFFRVRFDRLTPSEKRFLRAMAELGAGPYRMSDVAGQLQTKMTSLTPTRSKLINKGMIYSPAYGDVAFTVPLFDDFMRRAMPE